MKPNRIPAVSLTESPNLPCVLPNNTAIGSQAADHLIEPGYKNFVFYFWQSKAHELPWHIFGNTAPKYKQGALRATSGFQVVQGEWYERNRISAIRGSELKYEVLTKRVLTGRKKFTPLWRAPRHIDVPPQEPTDA